ncbi:PREDICTED: F-box protein CPR30-like [Erythranthe guttata]|uniref:F-box protein CPR30-like n=1 Tax=Erythranthe guttata TaxID=4155 RepID=UPI00064DC0AA|nr:PREDICTED: F-box protein CPR30-like [Erythranthe guttata]|eukprot:XP_012832951.1 PREDICTED: F-box protein CPR30-like [Erythranthe guttata]
MCDKLDLATVLDAPYGCDHVLCFCDGLLLVSRFLSGAIALWNTSTRTIEKISLPYSCYGSSYGVCRDPITDDFKVVILSYSYYTVYSCKNNSWKKKMKYECIEYFYSGYSYTSIMDGCPGVCVDGASYWVVEKSKRIMYFDPRDDKFKILQKPESIADDDVSKSIFLVDLGGSLCLYCNGRDATRVTIWAKEKGIDSNSWKKLVTIRNVETSIKLFEPQCFVGNKIVIRVQYDKGLVVYNTSKKRFKELKETKAFGIGLVPYLDTAFFPIEKSRSKRKRNSLQ